MTAYIIALVLLFLAPIVVAIVTHPGPRLARRPKAPHLMDASRQMRETRTTWLAMERASMHHWEMLCDCPPPPETYCSRNRALDCRCRRSPRELRPLFPHA